MTRHHAEPNINIYRQSSFWSHPLMIPLHCLWVISNNRMHGQFECDVTWFCFCFDFVQIKHVDCKMSTKNVNNYKWKTFRNIFGQLHTKVYKATKKKMRLQLKYMIVILELCFLFIDWLSFGDGGWFEIGCPRSRCGRILDVDGQGGGGSWKLDNFDRCHMCIIP